MPVKTFIACAAAGAAAGAAATTAYFRGGRRDEADTASPTAQPPLMPYSTLNTKTSIPPTPTGPYTPTPSPTTAIPHPTPAPVDPAGLFAYGFPGPLSDLRHTPSLISSFNRQTRNPHWVAEHITPASLALSHGDRKHSYFAEDPSIPPVFRAKLADYARSGYDRGHQVPAADAKWSQEAMDATFSLSNMCPQVGDGFNRDYWAHFEDFCRRLTGRYPSVRIVTGPLYLPARGEDGKYRVEYEVIGNPPNVAVPTHFYKVILAEDGRAGGNVSVGAFVLPNAAIDSQRSLKTFEVPLGIVERASGLDFAGKLDAGRKKRLCAEIECEVVVKEYKERQRSFGRDRSASNQLKPASGRL